MSAPGSPGLVFGDDGSPGADVAWLWINEQRWPGWRLETVTATGARLGDGPQPTVVGTERRPFEQAGFVSHMRRMPEQDPRLALCTDAELLVVGDRGRGLLKSLHLGSTVEWLAVRPPMPMVIARHGRPTRSVVLASDGSVDARAATDALAGLPFIDGLTVTIAVVDDDSVADLDDVIDRAAHDLRERGATTRPHVVRGAVNEELAQLISSTGADLVACGTRGRGLQGHVRLGSTARHLVHNRDVSVLITHRRIGTAPESQSTMIGGQRR